MICKNKYCYEEKCFENNCKLFVLQNLSNKVSNGLLADAMCPFLKQEKEYLDKNITKELKVAEKEHYELIERCR